jgi:hypothetical protein
MIKNAAHDFQRLQDLPHSMASWRHAQEYLRASRNIPALASYRKLVQQFPLPTPICSLA